MSSISSFTSQTRITGLSGFDTESMVTELMKAERIPLDAMRQKRTLVEWKQEAYRDTSSSLIGFKSKFFDIVNRSSYLLSENSVTPMTTTSSNSSYVTATAAADANAGTQSIKVIQLATAAAASSSAGISKDITGNVTGLNLAGKKIKVELDGVTKEIALGNYSSNSELAAGLQASLEEAFGGYKLNVTMSGSTLSIGTQGGATKVTVYEPSSGTSGLANLGLTSGDSNRISLKNTLESLAGSLSSPMVFNAGGTVDFSINGKTISAKATDTLGDVFEKINNDKDVNAQIKYDETTDKITLTTKQTGAGNTLAIGESGSNFLASLKLGTITEGKDAKVSINDGDTLVRSTNNFTINGITYTLNKAHETTSEGDTITVAQNTDSVIKNVSTFIEEYNKMIDSINDKVSEAHNRDYQPLTDEQKEDLEAADIEKWDKKAKSGILRNDSLLQQITLSMRKALFEKVEGVGLTLKDIGIESKSYADKGKLYLDEDKLKNALINKPDEVTKLINGVSKENPTYLRSLTTEQRADRYSKSGVFQRLSDIIEDNVSTKTDSDGKKGLLLEKAGIENDRSNTDNVLYDELEDFDDRIDTLISKLTKKEQGYYAKFANLETMLSQMNQQSSWITSQFSSQ